MLLPTVLDHKKNQDVFTLNLSIDSGIEFFKGHFDEAPIIPGVAQLYWAIEFYINYFKPESRPIVSNISALKFQQVIPPDTKLVLTLEFDRVKNILLFSFASDNAKFSSGKIVFI